MEKKKIKKTKAGSVFKSISSVFIWGLGQLLNKQWLKALFFFVFFIAFIGVEVGTSKYGKKIDPYNKISGEPMVYIDKSGNENHSALTKHLYVHMRSYLAKKYPEPKHPGDPLVPEKVKEFLKLSTTSKPYFKENDFISFLAKDIKENNHTTFTSLRNNEIVISDIDYEYQNIINNYKMIIPTGTLYSNDGITFYKRTLKDIDVIFKEVDFLTEEENGEFKKDYELPNLIEYSKSVPISGSKKMRNSNFYYDISSNTLYLDILIGGQDVYYINLMSKEIIKKMPITTKKLNNYGPIYCNKDYSFYEKFEPGLSYNGKVINYKHTKITDALSYAFSKMKEDTLIASSFTNSHFQYFHFKLYIAIRDDIKARFEKDFTNFFYEKAGFFLRGFWGLATLGTTHNLTVNISSLRDILLTKPTENGNILYEKTYDPDNDVNIQGHISTKILLESLISTIAFLFFLIFMIWSAIDAYKTSERKRKEQEVLSTKEYFKDVYESSFEYIVLSPALLVLAFISIMPILFGFLIAFTSISGDASLTGTFDWIGFKNFSALFNFNSNLGAAFGRNFWKVLLWTFIWAIFSTLTVFFAGLSQALILNSKRVVFPKFWRSLFILPWAVPAIISQMVFKVMFDKNGYINSFLGSIGVNDFLRSIGWLGRDFSQLKGAERWFYLGRDRIEWFTNPHNKHFVRASLIILNIWLGFPYFMALMTGVMTSIDKTLYEAADIDGATSRQKLRKITMPLVLYSTTPILVMTFSGNFNNFGVIYFITGGGPNSGNLTTGFAGDTDILISWMYKLTVEEQVYNIASVFSILIFIFVGTITAISLSRTRAFKGEM